MLTYSRRRPQREPRDRGVENEVVKCATPAEIRDRGVEQLQMVTATASLDPRSRR
jgi:hypothetical protein